MEGFDTEGKTGMSRRLEEAISRLTLALEELEENRREEEHFNSVGAKWKQVAKIIDRLEAHHHLSYRTVGLIITLQVPFLFLSRLLYPQYLSVSSSQIDIVEG